ncbi:MAG: hypothetical protein MJZ82_02665 [Paludibacteraceae bacterium]|nr:hypothetical protein [Paludibacteraceae bacterium]
MKKLRILAIAIAFVGFAAAANAQPRAIGGRIGYGVDFSYQHSVGENMVQLEVGLPGFYSIAAACTYDWIDPFGATVPWNQRGEWHWYMGVGGAGGYFWGYRLWGYYGGDAGFIGVAGRFGIEYDFWFPLQLSLDWRPVVGPYLYGDGVNTYADYYVGGLYEGGIALGVRYKF